METPKIELYMGSVKEVKDRVTYEITADIPGVAEEVRAFPWSRGEMDEPVEGNLISLIAIDPVYHSVYLYTKLKENDFIGLRSNGKMIDVTPDYISVGVYETDTTSKDGERPDLSKSYMKLDSEGNIDIMATGNETIKISGDAEVEVSGNVTVKVSGNADIKVSGDAKVNVSGTTDIDGPTLNINSGTINMNKKVPALGTGPLCGIPACLFTGAQHGSNTAG